ncbi:MAG TPA: hypothetical protein VLE53_19140 [Gemmatimonadaceae bacterium]|nr:hypothetical protein [Gemmatimonadaceae bacterium]
MLPPRLGAWLARRVPGGYAGGPYPLSAWTEPWVLLLRDTTSLAAASRALDTLRPPPDPSMLQPRPDTVIARPARWDLAELYDWLEHLESNLRGARGGGINGWGIDERNNRIQVLIESASTIPALLTWLENLSLPCHLVAFRVVGRISIGAGAVPRSERTT